MRSDGRGLVDPPVPYLVASYGRSLAASTGLPGNWGRRDLRFGLAGSGAAADLWIELVDMSKGRYSESATGMARGPLDRSGGMIVYHSAGVDYALWGKKVLPCDDTWTRSGQSVGPAFRRPLRRWV